MFVPLDTLRDFIHVDDAARYSLHWLSESAKGSQVRVIATGRGVTLGYIINQMKLVTMARIPVAYGVHESSSFQALDLRLTPNPIHSSRIPGATPLPVGMKTVFVDTLRRYQGFMSNPTPSEC